MRANGMGEKQIKIEAEDFASTTSILMQFALGSFI